MAPTVSSGVFALFLLLVLEQAEYKDWSPRSLIVPPPPGAPTDPSVSSLPQLYSSWNSLNRMWGERQKHLEDQLQASVTDQGTMQVRRASCLGSRRCGQRLLARKEHIVGMRGAEVLSPSDAPFRLLFPAEWPL